jgi:hypothetical protein
VAFKVALDPIARLAVLLGAKTDNLIPPRRGRSPLKALEVDRLSDSEFRFSHICLLAELPISGKIISKFPRKNNLSRIVENTIEDLIFWASVRDNIARYFRYIATIPTAARAKFWSGHVAGWLFAWDGSRRPDPPHLTKGNQAP